MLLLLIYIYKHLFYLFAMKVTGEAKKTEMFIIRIYILHTAEQ